MGRTGDGVEIRDSSIRLKFSLDGVPVKERLQMNGQAMAPTAANIKYARRLAGDVRRAIDQGRFTWAEFFPESARAEAAKIEKNNFGKLANLWLEAQGQLTPATKDQYGTAVRFWKRLLGDETEIPAITHKVLAAKIGGYPWPSAKTHNNYLIALRGIFALEFRGVTALLNPMIGIANLTVVRRLPDPLTIQERDFVLADMAKHYDERITAYFQFAFFTGMRPQEIIALRWSDIDGLRNIARMQRVRTFKGSEREGSKTHIQRDVDLVPEALEALAVMAKYTKMLRTERGGDDDTAADVFQNPVTRAPWHDERSQRDHYWRPTLKRKSIRWRRAYCCRHTFATTALMGNVPPAYIAAQLGHSLKMLLEVYARWMPENDQGGARAMLAAAMRTDSSQIGPKAANGADTQDDRK